MTSNLPFLIAKTNKEDGDASSKNLAEYYARLGQWCDQAYEEGISSQENVPEIKEQSAALDYLCGLQWKESMPSYRARPVNNEMLAMFWETIGLLTDVKPMFHISDIGSKDDYSKTQKMLNQLAKGWASTSSFSRGLAFATMFGMLTTAPAKLYWNPMARGSSSDPLDGDISFEACPVTSVLRLGINGPNIGDEELLIYRRVRTLAWIRRAYPRMGKLVQAEEPKSKYTVDVRSPVTVMPQLFQQLSPAMKRMMGASEKEQLQSVYPKAEVREFWMKDDSINESSTTVVVGPKSAPWSYRVAPGKKLYPRGRLVIRANNVTLYDEPNPYYHRRPPFALLGLNAVPWQQYAMSVLSPWMKQQDVLNQIMQGILENVKKAVRPPLIASKQAIHPEAMRAIDSAKPNLKITYNGNAGSPPGWGKPPDLPGYVMQSYGMVKSSMQQSSGAAAVGDAMGKKQVPGGDTLDRINFSRNTPIRFMGGNVEDFVDDVGMMWTATALQFYNAEHRMELLGDKGLVKEDMDNNPASLIPEGINAESFVRRWKFKSDKGTLLNFQRQDRIQVAFALRKTRDISRDTLLDVVDWNIDRKKNNEDLAEEAKAMAAAGALGKGKK